MNSCFTTEWFLESKSSTSSFTSIAHLTEQINKIPNVLIYTDSETRVWDVGHRWNPESIFSSWHI